MFMLSCCLVVLIVVGGAVIDAVIEVGNVVPGFYPFPGRCLFVMILLFPVLFLLLRSLFSMLSLLQINSTFVLHTFVLAIH